MEWTEGCASCLAAGPFAGLLASTDGRCVEGTDVRRGQWQFSSDGVNIE